MKKIIFLFILSGLFFSCQQSANGPQPVPQQMGGTDSAGGGNGVNGKPLDAYIDSHFTEREAFKQRVSFIIKDLIGIDPQVAGDFYHIALNRDWYFIPVDLDMISQNIVGSYGRTDQLALQDLNKVWVNQKFYDVMKMEDASTLIVHEIVMGMRLMEYQHRQDSCIAEASWLLVKGIDEANLKEYQGEKNKCRNTYPKIVGTYSNQFHLNAEDYDLIRKVVSLIITREKAKLEEAVVLIKSSKLRIYE